MTSVSTKKLYHTKSKTCECKYRPNGGVDCDTNAVCSKCGWNPVVEAERKRLIRGERIENDGQGNAVKGYAALRGDV